MAHAEPADIELNTAWLLAMYGLGIAVASLLGGWLLHFFQITHTRMQIAMAFVAGLILGVAIFHLLPHSLTALSGSGGAETAVGWMMTGMVSTLVLFYLFDFHEHDFSEEHEHQHDQRGSFLPKVKTVTWVGIALGLGIHSLTEGLTLTSTMRLAPEGAVTAASFGVFLAVALHKPLDALSLLSTMQANGLDRRATRVANLSFALLCPLAAFVAYWGIGRIGPSETQIIGCALAFASGSFLCISLNDLLPEIHFHSHDRLKLAASFLVGIAIAYALHWVEPSVLHGFDQHALSGSHTIP